MKYKKIIAIISAVALSISLFSGCGSTGKTPQGSGAKEPSGSGDKTVGKMNITGLPICTEPQTFTIAVSKNTLSKNNFPEKQSVKDTEQKTNVKIDWMEIPASGWKEKTNIMFASGDLPDVMLGAVDVVKNQASLAPMGDAIQKYAPSIQRLFQERPDVRKAVTAPNGNIYSLPIGDESYNNLVTAHLWINKAWLEKLGLKVPETTSEYYNVLKAFKEKDPNGNGKADEIPFSACQNSTGQHGIDNMFGPFGTLDNANHVRVEGGKVIFAPSEKNYLDGLQWLNKLYTEDLMDKETFIHNQQQYFSKGKEADIIGSFITFSPDEVVAAQQMNNYIGLLPLKGPEGKQLWNKDAGFNYNYYSITAKCKTPEVMVRWYDYLNSDIQIALEWNRGPKDTAWRLTPDGKWEIASDKQPKDIAYGEWRHTISPASTAPVFMKSAWVGPDGQNFTTPRDKLKVDTVKAYLPYVVKEVIPIGLDDPARVDQRNLYGADIDNYLKKFKANSVMQGVDNTSWQNHLNTLKTLKVDEYTKLWQEFVDSKK